VWAGDASCLVLARVGGRSGPVRRSRHAVIDRASLNPTTLSRWLGPGARGPRHRGSSMRDKGWRHEQPLYPRGRLSGARLFPPRRQHILLCAR